MAEIISDRDDFIHKTLCIKPLADKIHEIPRFKKVSEQDVLEIARILITEIELEKNDFCKADISDVADKHPVKWGQLKALKKFVKKYTDPPLPQEKPNPKGGNADADTVFQSGTEVSCKNRQGNC